MLSPAKLRLLERRLAREQPSPQQDRIERCVRDGPLPSSFAQRRLWFLDRVTPGRPTYNVAHPVWLTGLLDLDLLRQAVELLVSRHEVLRTTFAELDGEPIQVVHPPG